MNQCNQCGKNYHEWECPTCSVEGTTLVNAHEHEEVSFPESVLPPLTKNQQKKRKQFQEYMASEGWRLEVQSKLARGIDLYYSELYDEALQLTEPLLKQDPSNINIHLVLERIYDASGNYQKGKEHADKALKYLTIPENVTNVEAHMQVALAQANSAFRNDLDPPDTIGDSMEAIHKIYKLQERGFKKTKLAVARYFAFKFDENYELYSRKACNHVKQCIQNKSSYWNEEMEFNGLRTAFSSAWFAMNETFGYSVFMAIALGVLLVINASISLYNLAVSVIVAMVFSSIFIFAFEILHWYIEHEKCIKMIINSSEKEPFSIPKYKSSLIFWVLNILSLGMLCYVGIELYPYILRGYNTVLPYLDDMKETIKEGLKYIK